MTAEGINPNTDTLEKAQDVHGMRRQTTFIRYAEFSVFFALDLL